VSLLRQKQKNLVVPALQNLVSCCKAMPEETPMAWSEPEEIKDSYATYCTVVGDAAKRLVLQKALGVDDEDAQAIHGATSAQSGGDPEDDQNFF
jgi:hypothetical protein